MEGDKNKSMNVLPQNNGPDTIPSFLLKTYEILENDKYIDTISWTKNGEGFIVKKVKEFSENVLPIYFRHSNYTSFVRQLNMYDFHKTRQENHENAFKNLMFKKGCKHLLKDIQRKDYKKNKDNAKETTADRALERSTHYGRNDKNNDASRDLGRQQLKKMNELQIGLEKKALFLAQLQDIPAKQPELLRLLDALFDAKKMHKDLMERMQRLGLTLPERRGSQVLVEKTSGRCQVKEECPSTQGREGPWLMTPREKERQSIGTGVSLFGSFNQI